MVLPGAIKKIEDKLFDVWFGKRYPGFVRNHVKVSQQTWMLCTWDQKYFDSVTDIKYGKDGNFIEKMAQLWKEILSDQINKTVTTIFPKNKIVENNILLLNGIGESSKRDTDDSPETTTGVQFLGFGIDNTAENESQTGLISAVDARIDLDVLGQRKTISQTSKYNATATDVELTTPVTLKEAVLYNKLTVGKGHARIQFPDFPFNSGDRITVQINELQRNL